MVVKPGRPAASLLFQAITAKDEASRMPPDSPALPKAQIELIRHWIDNGLRETRTSKSLAPSRTIKFDPGAIGAAKPDGPPPMPVELPDFQPTPTKRRLPVLAMASSPVAPLLAVSGQQHVRLFNIVAQKQIGALAFPEGVPHVLRFSRNGAVLLAAGGKPVQSGSVVLFDVRNGKRLAQLGDELDAVLAADLSPDQRLVALGGSGRTVKVYSTTSSRLKYKLTRHTDWITSIAFSPDGKRLATADRAGGIHLWDATTGGIQFSLSNHTASVRTLAWRGDSKLLASGGEDGRLTWWNPSDGFVVTSRGSAHPPRRPTGEYGRLRAGILSATFSKTGYLLSSGRDRFLRLWNLTAKQHRSIEIRDATPTQVAVSFDAKTLIAGDSLGKIHFHEHSPQ